MTDMAVEISLDESLVREWKGISDKIKKKSSKRNAFAHYVLVQEFDESEDVIEFYYSLQPNIFDSGRKIKHRGKVPKLVLSDIRAQSLAFSDLADTVGKFADKLDHLDD